MSTLNISTCYGAADSLWFILSGRLDTHTAEQFHPYLNRIRIHADRNVVLDLTELEYISSAGLRCIFRIRRMMRAMGGEVFVFRPGPQVRQVLRIIKAVPSEAIFEFESDLVQRLRQSPERQSMPEACNG